VFRNIGIQKIKDYEDIRWFESFKFLIPENPKQGEGDMWRTEDFLSRFVKEARRSTILAFQDFRDRKMEVTEYLILSISNSRYTKVQKDFRRRHFSISGFGGSRALRT
jgi:hypothetical protein